MIDIYKSLKPVNDRKIPLKRFGPDWDGGYLVVDSIDPKTVLISAGIGYDFEFEQDIFKHFSNIYMIDKNINPDSHSVPNAIFIHKFLSNYSDNENIMLGDLAIPPKNPYIFKCDIEGSELNILLNSSNDLFISNADQIIIELHMFSNPYNHYKTAINKILKTHDVIWSHPNNIGPSVLIDNILFPEVVEVLFLKKSLTNNFPIDNTKEYIKKQSIELSFDNDPDMPSLYYPNI